MSGFDPARLEQAPWRQPLLAMARWAWVRARPSRRSRPSPTNGFAASPRCRSSTSRAGYGWAGGLGTSWANDPGEGLVGVVLTTDMFSSAFGPPEVIRDFWTCVYTAIDD